MADLVLCLGEEKLFENRGVLWIEHWTMKTMDIRRVQTTKLKRLESCVTSCFYTKLPTVPLCSQTDCFFIFTKQENKQAQKSTRRHNCTQSEQGSSKKSKTGFLIKLFPEVS